MTTIRAAALAAVTALALSGCASIVSGTTDQVEIDSDPSGKDCVVYQAGDVVGRVTTPETIVVKRAASDLLVTCGDSRARAGSGFNAVTLGNIPLLALGIFGLLTDAITGAYHDYDDVEVRG